MTDLKEKIYAALQKKPISVLATLTEDNRPWCRYVSPTAKPDLTLYVATFASSRKIKQIEKNPQVHLTCGASTPTETEAYLQIEGVAEISNQKELRHGVWNDEMKAYFKGPDDPNYRVVVVRPYRIEYNSMASMTPEVWNCE